MSETVTHGPWTITFDPPPGPPDWRCGRAASVEEALAAIAEREADEADWREHVALKATPQAGGSQGGSVIV